MAVKMGTHTWGETVTSKWLWPVICMLIILSTASLPGREARSSDAIYEAGGFDLNVKIQIVFWMCALFVAIKWTARNISVFEFVRTLQNLPIIRWAAVFVCLSALSTLWSVSFKITLFRAMQLFVVLILVVWLVRTKQSYRHILSGLYWTIAVFGVLSIVGLIFWPEANRVTMGGASLGVIRLGGPFYSAGAVGEAVATLVVGLFCRAMSSRGNNRKLLFLASVLALGIVLATRSRTALIILYLVFCTLLVARKAGVLAILLTVFFGLFISLGDGLHAVEIVNRGEGLQSILTLNNRTTIWTETLEIAFEKPWLGRGYVAGNRDVLNEQIAQKEMNIGGFHAHNAALAAFMDTGLIGAVLIILFYFEMLIVTFKNVSQTRRTKKNFWVRMEICSIGIAIVVQGLPACGMAGKLNPMVVFALLAAVAILHATQTFGLNIKAPKRII